VYIQSSPVEIQTPPHWNLNCHNMSTSGTVIITITILIVILVLQPGSSLHLPIVASPLHSVHCLGFPVVTSTSFKAFFSTLYNKCIVHFPILLGRPFSFYSIITDMFYENVVFQLYRDFHRTDFVGIHIWYSTLFLYKRVKSVIHP